MLVLMIGICIIYVTLELDTLQFLTLFSDVKESLIESGEIISEIRGVEHGLTEYLYLTNG